jgi:hypothetical protein
MTGNVTLPGERHQTGLCRAGLASDSPEAGDDPVNGVDPTGEAPDSLVFCFPLRAGGCAPLWAGCDTCQFGAWKIAWYHNIFRLDIIAYTILHGARNLSPQPPNQYTYDEWWINVYNGGLRFILHVVYDQNIGGDSRLQGNIVGIVTAYCLGYIACPLWVNYAPLQVGGPPTAAQVSKARL